MIYEPSEDSELLAQTAASLCALLGARRVLEVGVGSGYVLERIPAPERFGTDLNPAAVSAAQERVEDATIRLGDLTEPFDGPFDLIVFNPPYLPADATDRFLSPEVKAALIGGTSGLEVSRRFLAEARSKLALDGAILLIASSHTDLARFEWDARNLGYMIASCSERALPGFEKVVCYRLGHNEVSRYALERGYRLRFAIRGGRSIVYELRRGDERVAAKLLLGEKAPDAKREFGILRALHGRLPVPEPLDLGDAFLAMEYIDGVRASDLSEGERRSYDDQLIAAALALDRLRIRKREFTRPFGNVLVRDGRIVLVDFERAQEGKRGNVTQLLEHFRRRGSMSIDIMRRLSTDYLKDVAASSVDESRWNRRILEALR